MSIVTLPLNFPFTASICIKSMTPRGAVNMTLADMFPGSGQLRWMLIVLILGFGIPSIAVAKSPPPGATIAPMLESLAGCGQYINPDADKGYASSAAWKIHSFAASSISRIRGAANAKSRALAPG